MWTLNSFRTKTYIEMYIAQRSSNIIGNVGAELLIYKIAQRNVFIYRPTLPSCLLLISVSIQKIVIRHGGIY